MILQSQQRSITKVSELLQHVSDLSKKVNFDNFRKCLECTPSPPDLN